MVGVMVDQHMPDMTMTYAVVDQQTRWLAKRSTRTPDGWCGGRPAHARHDNDQRSGRPAHQMACEAVDEHKWSTSTCQTSQWPTQWSTSTPDGWRSGRPAQVVDQHTRWLAQRLTSTSGRPAHLDGWRGGRPASYVCNDVFPTLYSSVCKGWLDRNERQNGIG